LASPAFALDRSKTPPDFGHEQLKTNLHQNDAADYAIMLSGTPNSRRMKAPK
jgi:hypothetical protein